MTTENNKIIAEFMGMKPHNKNDLEGFWTNTIKVHEFNNVMNLKFHSDWNWLMEVVEKIESLGNFNVSIEFGNCTISGTFTVSKTNKTKIEAVYNACLAFIEWYNENAVKELKTEENEQ